MYYKRVVQTLSVYSEILLVVKSFNVKLSFEYLNQFYTAAILGTINMNSQASQLLHIKLLP